MIPILRDGLLFYSAWLIATPETMYLVSKLAKLQCNCSVWIAKHSFQLILHYYYWQSKTFLINVQQPPGIKLNCRRSVSKHFSKRSSSTSPSNISNVQSRFETHGWRYTPLSASDNYVITIENFQLREKMRPNDR